MITVQDMERLLFTGGDVVGPDGRRIGAVGQLFLDATTGDPAWVTVSTGLFGTSESFVPLAGAQVHGDDIVVPYDKDQVKHAPRVDSAEGHLPPDRERDLYRHYGLLHDEPAADPATAPGPAVPDDEGAAVAEGDARPGEPDVPAGAPGPAESGERLPQPADGDGGEHLPRPADGVDGERLPRSAGDEGERRPEPGTVAAADDDPGAHRRTGRHVADPGPR